MSPELFSALAVVLVAAVSGLVTWKVARRSTSGDIDTSEASMLWLEGTSMRKELRDEVASLKAQLVKAIGAIGALNTEIASSRYQIETAREETRQSRAEIRALMAQIDNLHSDNRSVLAEVRTSTALTIGALADNSETRRILDLSPADRTPQEQDHLDSVENRLPDSQRAYQGDEEP